MSDSTKALERYRTLVGDWDSFLHCVQRPLPACVWIRPDVAPYEAMRSALADDGIEGTRIAWSDWGLRLSREPVLADSLAYRTGLFHVLEEVSMLPVALLQPRPGERILDLCSAPGNKTALLAASMHGSGTVVANDVSRGRQSVTRTTLHRLGLCNVTVTAADGADPRWAGLDFDRVLVDAPCSCEGTVRKHPSSATRTTDDMRARLVHLQGRLLRSAISACRPGGRVVYATCTFAPEENEGVVSDVLEQFGDRIRVVPVTVPGLPADPGLSSWCGRSFRPELHHAIRVWPHRGDTGGFFCAVLERSPAGQPGGASVPESPARPADRAVVDPLLDWFGIPSRSLSDLRFAGGSGKYVSLVSSDHAPRIPFEPVSTGLTAIRARSHVPKLTTQGCIALGRRATRNVLELAREDVLDFVSRQQIPIDGAAVGHQIVRWFGHPVGLGLSRPGLVGARLESLYPRIWAGLQPTTEPD